MKLRTLKLAALVAAHLVLTAYTQPPNTAVKCLIQMTNYTGEGAYIVVSLLSAEGKYDQTLCVLGTDDEWYSEIPEWWDYYGKRRTDIDGISGETLSGGERSVSVLQIPSDKIDAGYQLRFETAVEDQEYYSDDLQFELTSQNLKTKKDGKGFIRYVRMLPQ